MFSRGEFTIDNITYGAIASHTKVCTEVALVLSGQVVSAYKTDVTGSYSYNNNRAKELAQLIIKGAKGCTAKNGMPAPFELGAVMMHEFIKAKVEYLMKMYKGEVVGAYIQSDRIRVDMDYCKDNLIPPQIPYVKLTEVKKTDDFAEDDLDAIPVRSVEEIALEKESVEWLANKKYYIVNDDEVAENIFKFLENYNNVIAYDTETTGLRINCFGKIGSSYMQSLEEYNIQCKPEDKIRADKLVGIIFCVEPDVSYYFPCFNRKFKNLYQDKNSEIRKKVIQHIRARYTLGNSEYLDTDMLKYVMNTPDDDMDLGVILMERVRGILSTKHLVAHNGTFEWKVGYQYGIDTNIKDDTMIMHKIMYKFRSTTSNRGEPSDLKYLAKRELGMDQWELKDFFPNLKENKSGTIRSKSGAKKQSKGSLIDFSYMTYEGTKVYAPTDGDVTLQLFYKYKKDLIKNHSEMIYIYEVEVIVSMAIAYMEFYGHRIDETKIANAKNQTLVNLALIESEIRQAVEYADDKELEAYNELKNIQNEIKALDKDTTESGKAKKEELESQLIDYCDKLKGAISDNTKHVINLSAPGQVADLFYDVLKYPLQGDKKSVAKAVIKALLKEKNEDGSPKYPVANMYSKYKNEETLLSKFFDNLQYFMYPGGFIFSSYGQIAAATGRMSCIEENTHIRTKYGYRRIKDIEKGDMVYCYDNNGDIAIRKVLSVIKNGRKKCIKLWFKGECRACSLVCTPDHRIRKSDGTWVQACRLGIGDKVSGMSSKRAEYELKSIENVKEKIVYDLEIEEYHNFIAGEICVHNCSKPNAQQYPKVITKIVYPRDGYVMLDADYSQIEYRVLTAMAHNDDLAKMFSDPDSDYHTLMASLMYDVDYASVTPKMRSSAKSFNFGIPYGMGFGSLAILLHGNKKQSSIDDAKDKYELYFKNQPRTRQFFDNVKEMAQINGWTKTLFNRYRYYSFVDADGNVNNARKAAALRQAGNAVIQGCLGGETRIQTKEFGIVKIKDYAGYNRVQIWDGDRWTLGDITYSGKKQKCIVHFSNGQSIVCSPIHKFLVKSSKGNERFVECQNLRGSIDSTNPHRVVINRHYEPSDYEYSSEWALKYATWNHMSNNAFVDNIDNSFNAGVVLGRLASDGSIIKRDVGASYILHYIAEHEVNIVPILERYMQPWGYKYKENEVRKDRNEKVNRIYTYSESLVNELLELDIKHRVSDNIFMDTELLRGFISGFFDGDGGISGKTITLTFGTQYDFREMCEDMQKALLFFGIRSRYREYEYRHVLTIKTNDNQKFLDLIGFLNEDKNNLGRQLKCIKEEKLFGPTLVVESVEITDEYIDMYDVCNTERGYYVADGIITHNTAADIFKIGVARNFNYIRKNRLFGKLLIVNMVHDEQLMELDTKSLNIQRVVTDVCKNMQFGIEGFPPLYVGAGLGQAWGVAKGKMAEIHPQLLEDLTKESDSIPIFQREGIDKAQEPKEVLDYFDNRIHEFRRRKVYDYLSNQENWNKDIHPAIGSLINLQFNYGRGDEASAYVGPNGEKYTDQEFLELNIGDFLKENQIPAEPTWFKFNESMNEQKKEEAEKESDEYDDTDDEELEVDDILIEAEDSMGIFSQIDESNKLFGSSIQDIINVFGCCVLVPQKLCGINIKGYNWKQVDLMIEFLVRYECEKDDPDALRIVFLKDGNVLKYVDFWVKNIKASELEAQYKGVKATK